MLKEENKDRIIWGLNLLIDMYKDCINTEKYKLKLQNNYYCDQKMKDYAQKDIEENQKEIESIKQLIKDIEGDNIN